MDSNTHSDRHRLAALGAAVEDLAAQDLGGLSDAVRAERVLVLRRLLDRLEGTGSPNWPPWTPAGPPAPNRMSRSARPPAGCASASGWVVVPPTARSGPPGPCSAAPWPTPPRP